MMAQRYSRKMMRVLAGLWTGICADWHRSVRGSVAMYVAVLLPVLITSIGLSIDLSQAYLVRERLSRAVDAAALAAAGSTFTGSNAQQSAQMQKRIEDFMAANYPKHRIGSNLTVNFNVMGDDIKVSASINYDTFFMTVIGKDVISVQASSTVRKQIKGVEAVLVLDNTGSMSYRPNNKGDTNMQALQIAARDFVNIMFDRARNNQDVRIGLVPYANAVRIGRYGLGLEPNGDPYLDRSGEPVEPFVELPPGMKFTNNRNHQTDWYGCVIEHMDSNYNPAAKPVSGAYGQLWSTDGTTRCNSRTSCRGHGWDPGASNNDPSPQESTDDYEGPWGPYMFGRIISNNQRCTDRGSGFSNNSSSCSNCTGTSGSWWNQTTGHCADAYCYCKYTYPANSCPTASILPMTSDRQKLLAAINTMDANGNTQGNAGMTWGYRMISPGKPFTEASQWGSDYWSKAIIMMTDGDNTMDGNYSYYWDSGKNNIAVSSNSPKGLNQRFRDVCDALKAKDPPVLIYTIVFKSQTAVSNANKQFYKDCATSSATYFEAPTQEALKSVFQQIARELSNLHIKE